VFSVTETILMLTFNWYFTQVFPVKFAVARISVSNNDIFLELFLTISKHCDIDELSAKDALRNIKLTMATG